jgi:hypothetical protein
MRSFIPRVFGALVALLLSTSAHGTTPAGRYTFPTADTVYDTKTKLTWQRALSPNQYYWSGAKPYCASLNLNGTGWRLPTAKELATIVDPTRQYPAVDLDAFPGTPQRYAHSWSSTPDVTDDLSAWAVGYDTGGVGSAGKDSNLFNVRCVR